MFVDSANPGINTETDIALPEFLDGSVHPVDRSSLFSPIGRPWGGSTRRIRRIENRSNDFSGEATLFEDTSSPINRSRFEPRSRDSR